MNSMLGALALIYSERSVSQNDMAFLSISRAHGVGLYPKIQICALERYPDVSSSQKNQDAWLPKTVLFQSNSHSTSLENLACEEHSTSEALLEILKAAVTGLNLPDVSTQSDRTPEYLSPIPD